MREEDEKLREAVEMYGARWSKIAEAVGTRNGDQCWKRWYDCLDPRIDKSPWTTAEVCPEHKLECPHQTTHSSQVSPQDALLLQLVAQNGRNWSDIVHRHFPNRTSLSAKNRYSILRRKQTTAGSSPKKSSNNSSPSVSTTRFTPSSSISSNSFLNIPTTPSSVSRSTSATPEPDSLDMEALNFDWMALTETEVDELLYQGHQMGPLSATASPQIGYDSSFDSAPGNTSWAASSTTTTAWAPSPNLGFDPNVAGGLTQPPAAQSHAEFHDYTQQQQQSQLQERSQGVGYGYNMPGVYQTGYQTQRTGEITYDMGSNGLMTHQTGMGSWHAGYGTGW